MKKFGYIPLVASSGEEALETYAKRRDEIDLLIVDLGMPGMGGRKCLQELIKTDPDVKVLIATGYSVNGQVKDTLKAGARGFIGKPYNVSALLEKIRTIIDD